MIELGVNARGEVIHRFKDGGKRAQCRFDIAIFNSGGLTGIIEVKADDVRHTKPSGWLGTRQGERYMRYGVPIRLVYGMDDARDAIDDAKNGKLFALAG